MNDEIAYIFSKRHDKILVDWLNKKKNPARLATKDEDEKEKWDILVNSFRVDTKYPHACLNATSKKLEVWFEYSKLCGPMTRKVDQVWYFIQGKYKCQLFFKKKELADFLAKKYDAGEITLKKSKTAKSGRDPSDMICYVALDEVKKIAFAKGIEEWIQKTS